MTAILGDDKKMESFLRRIFDTWISGQAGVPQVALVRYADGEVQMHAPPTFCQDMDPPMVDRLLRSLAKAPEMLVHGGGLDGTFLGVSLLGLADLGTGRHAAQMTLVARNDKIYDINFQVPSEIVAALPSTVARINALTHALVPAATTLVGQLHRELAARGQAS